MSSSNSESEYIEYGSECYEVEAIRERKFVKGKPHYFIKWKGWAEADNTWEPLQNLETVINLVKEFDSSLDSKNDANSLKKDKKFAESKLPSNTSHIDLPKKTKPIEKEKKNKKSQKQKSQGEMSQSESESLSSKSSKKSNSKKKDKKQPKKELSKKISTSQVSEKSKLTERQKQKEKEKLKQKEKEIERKKSGKQSKGKELDKSREKDRERFSQISSSKKNDSKAVNQQKQLENLSKQASVKLGSDQPLDFIEILRINYHLIVPPEIPNQTPQILYNVDRRNRITKKPMATMEIPAEEMFKRNVSMVVEYLENFVREVEICANEQREYERRRNGETPANTGEVKLGVIGKMRK